MDADRKRIFIVEDETIVAEALRLRLENLGYTVTGTATRGEDAIALITAAPPDLVLMDIRLADHLDGVTVGQQIHDRFGIPIVYLTANTNQKTLKQVLSGHAAGYVAKPIHDASFQSAISIALQKHAEEQNYRRRERHYLSTLAKLTDAVLVLDATRRPIYLNPAAVELTGSDGSDCARDDEVLVFLGEAGESIDPVAQCLAQGQEVRVESVWCQSRAGKRVHVQVEAIPIPNAQGAGGPEARHNVDVIVMLHPVQAAPAYQSLPEYIRVCAYCRDIMERNADNVTVTVRFETYFQRMCNFQFTHGICPNCRDAMVREMKSQSPG
ncbi:response regulator [Chloracidobacterium validum]|uniref:Response regulator n=1 Tax=Chloracidobacterium validum TaxID=2821543 RepID=A0ABX8B9T4_9BACT|nr:response regulator [Chloracidobacterium validum]QUW03182.1 response regulator [Chloracidobacterium validum]